MKTTDFINSYTEDAEYDDEASMVKNNLHTIIRVSTHLEREIADTENMPEWCQEKIAQVKGMIVSVMDYIISQHEMGKQEELPGFNPAAADVQMSEMLDFGNNEPSPVTSAITRRIMMQRVDLLQKYGPEKVGNAIDEVADFVGDVDEIGSSDVSGWVKQVERILGGMTEAKSLKKRVQVVKGPHAGKIGWIRQIKHGAFKGAPKSFFVDLDDGTQFDNVPGSALRLVKDEQNAFNHKPDDWSQDFERRVSVKENATGGASCAGNMGAVVKELGEEGMTKKQLNKRIGGYTNITTKPARVKVKGAY